MRPLIAVLCLVTGWTGAAPAIATLSPGGLRCEYRTDPAGIDSAEPRLSWTLDSSDRDQKQTAYEIIVSSSPEKLAAGDGDLWRTGKLAGSSTLNIPYRGKPLSSYLRCFWKVRVWDGEGRASDWSRPARWWMGILREADWNAQWIGWSRTALNSGPLPIFRREFSAHAGVRAATVYTSGLGFFELHINGRKVGDHVLDPGWTNYRRTALYVTHDVTSYLRPGANALGMLLGNGMYNVAGGRYVKFNASFGRPKFILHLRIEYQDGSVQTVVSDSHWKASAGPIRFSCIYGGEDYDARQEQTGWDQPGFDDQAWDAVEGLDVPRGILSAQSAPPVKVMQILRTVRVTEPSPGVRIFDLGQNFSGWPRVVARGAAGSTLKFTPGELLDERGLVTQRSSGGPVSFSYTLKGGGPEDWRPRFSYYGFRYVQVEGSAEVVELTGEFVHSSAARTGQFSCSNPLFNRIHTLIDAAVRSNLQSVVTDCPHREKLGWLEQTYLMGPSIACNYDISTLYAKAARDMRESQTIEGLVPDIAPEYVVFSDGFRDSPEWGSASVVVPWLVYRKYGDRRVLEESYGTMARYAAYLGSSAHDGIISRGLGDWYDIGPAAPGPSQLTPLGVTATASYYLDLTILEQAAQVLGRSDDAARYHQLASAVQQAFQKNFFHPETNIYATGSQTSNAMALALGLVPPQSRAAVLQNLVASVTKLGNQQTAGDIGYHYLVQALFEGGRSDVLFAMTNRTNPPSYGAQLANGATSLTEAWDANPASSQNHLMLGHIDEWFFSGLAGLTVDFDRIVIRPQPAGDVKWAKAEYDSTAGPVRSEWRIEGSTFELTVRIPPNVRAMVYVRAISAAAVTEHGIPVAKVSGVRVVGTPANSVQLDVPSGEYIFRAPVR